MTTQGDQAKQAMRQLAEAKLKLEAVVAPTPLSLAEANQMLHELRVHQIELEMQANTLLSSQAELEATRDRALVQFDRQT